MSSTNVSFVPVSVKFSFFCYKLRKSQNLLFSRKFSSFLHFASKFCKNAKRTQVKDSPLCCPIPLCISHSWALKYFMLCIYSKCLFFIATPVYPDCCCLAKTPRGFRLRFKPWTYLAVGSRANN